MQTTLVKPHVYATRANAPKAPASPGVRKTIAPVSFSSTTATMATPNATSPSLSYQPPSQARRPMSTMAYNTAYVTPANRFPQGGRPMTPASPTGVKPAFTSYGPALATSGNATTLPQPSQPMSQSPSALTHRAYSNLIPSVLPPVATAGATAGMSGNTQPFYFQQAPLPLDPNVKTVNYSDVEALLEGHQLRMARILLDPTSFSSVPVAELELNNGEKRNLILPRETEAFTNALERSDVPFTYQSTAKQGPGKIVEWGGNMLSEMFGPFVLLGGTVGLGMMAVKQFQSRQEESATQEAIHKAHKDMSHYPYDFDKIEKQHTNHNRHQFREFLNGNRSVLLAQGYPGIGKTHIMQALAKKVVERHPETMVLEIREGAGSDVRSLLNDVYSGDKVKAPKALKVLQKENGGKPVKELLLYSDEVENLPQKEMEHLLVNATGNAGGSPIPGMELPKLRMLATCNRLPTFLTSSEAVQSRVTFFLVPPPQSKVSSEILADALGKKMKDTKLPADLSGVLEPVLTEYPGYSPRTLADDIAPSMNDQLQGKKHLDAKTVQETLRQVLDKHSLNNTEMATLISEMIIQKVMRGRQPLDPERGPVQLWQILHHNAKDDTAGLNLSISLDGKRAKQQIAKVLSKQSLDFSTDGPVAIEKALKAVVQDLKFNCIDALRVPLPRQKATEQLLINRISHVIDESVNIEREDAIKEKRPANNTIVEKLEALKIRLQQVEPDSRQGKDLEQAARKYNAILDDEEDAKAEGKDVDPVTQMTDNKLNALISKAMRFNPAEGYGAGVQDEKYIALTMRLHRLLNDLSAADKY